jgi:hypothetical protein
MPQARAAAPYLFASPETVFEFTTDLIIAAVERAAAGSEPQTEQTAQPEELAGR